MKKYSFKLALFSIFFITSNFFSQYSFLKSTEIKEANIIGINYLKNFNNDNYYILGPGDQININVSRELPELNVISIVDGNGTIFIPKLNRVYVEGLTVNELINLLNTAYLEFVKYPNLEITIVNYRPIRVVVKGEVNKPKSHVIPGSLFAGSYDPKAINPILNLTPEINNKKEKGFYPTIFDAIIASEGITQFSDLSKIEVIRKNLLSDGGGYKKTVLDLTSNDNPTKVNQNIRIFDGDTIIVPKSNFPNDNLIYDLLRTTLNPEFLNVVVAGKVEAPGSIQLPLKASLNDALQLSGGLKVLPGPITLARINKNATIKTYKVKYKVNAKRGSKNNPYLANGDMIFVKKSIVNTTSEIIQQVTSPFAGLVSTYGLYKALTED